MYYMLYVENCDCMSPSASVRHFLSLKAARAALVEATADARASYAGMKEDDDHEITVTEDGVYIHDGKDTFSWSIAEVKPEEGKSSVKSLNLLYETRENGERDIFYFCNACGEINVPGMPCLYTGQPDELPMPARDLYLRYWTETVTPVYTVKISDKYGMAVLFLFSEQMLDESGLPYNEMHTILKDAASDFAGRLAAENVPGVDIYLGCDTDPEGSEVLVFIHENCCASLLGEYCSLGVKAMEKGILLAERCVERQLSGKEE